jgi:hypothetical protein
LPGEHLDRHVAHVALVRQVQHVVVAEGDQRLGRHPEQPALTPVHQPDREADQVLVPVVIHDREEAGKIPDDPGRHVRHPPLLHHRNPLPYSWTLIRL